MLNNLKENQNDYKEMQNNKEPFSILQVSVPSQLPWSYPLLSILHSSHKRIFVLQAYCFNCNLRDANIIIIYIINVF